MYLDFWTSLQSPAEDKGIVLELQLNSSSRTEVEAGTDLHYCPLEATQSLRIFPVILQ